MAKITARTKAVIHWLTTSQSVKCCVGGEMVQGALLYSSLTGNYLGCGEGYATELLADDKLPTQRRMRVRCVAWAAVGVMVTLVVVGVASLVLIGTARHLLSVINLSKPVEVKVGVLMSGSELDEDLRKATVLAVRDHVAAISITMDVQVREAFTWGTTLGALQAFKTLWSEGVRVFLVGGDGVQVEALCHYMEYSGRKALLVSPTSLISSDDCPFLASLSPSHGALITAEVAKLAGTGLTHLIPVITSREEKQMTHVMTAGKTYGITVAQPVHLHARNLSTAHLGDTLAALPEAGVWVSVGGHLPEIMTSVGHILRGRLVMLHTHPVHRAKLLSDPVARRIAEACAVCTVAWAGSSQMDAITRRQLLLALDPQNPLVATLAYDAASLALLAVTNSTVSDVPEMRRNFVDHATHRGVIKPADMVDGKVSGWAVRMRLVAKHLVGQVVLQETPWLLEGLTRVEGGEKHPPWVVVRESHSPTRLVTQEELQELAAHTHCDMSTWIEVTAHDPLTHRPVTTTWRSTAPPHVLLIPNGSPGGFSVRTWCQSRQGAPHLEIGCQGATTHNDSLRCVTVTTPGGPTSRRIIRSLITKHRFPIQRRRRYGPLRRAMKSIDKILAYEGFKALIPQIGGCLGSSGGCAFCFVYILLSDVTVSPGVCYGACGVAVGGSCGTLFAKGIQNKLDHTVICTELFTQGRLSLSSYLADASFGVHLATSNGQALRGYQVMATPLVAVMQVSPIVSDIVEAMARPWIQHMEYQEGLQANDDVLGHLITTVGLPFCSLVAVVVDHIDTIVLLTTMAVLCHQART
ncbi:uncharacterized protein LOC121855608 isoform X1 [Homarus americanus]|uniref:uncharacterized protein LOC121855608 isoform X1 n=1 Tax=Homarus americanus TaxID=6706 RepID=UPI001C45EAC2|nr:uncharacterized protein LOC121855608 isoform X1 [Homarus americanus]